MNTSINHLGSPKGVRPHVSGLATSEADVVPASPSPAAPTDGLVCPVCLSPVSEPWSCAPCSAKYGTQPAIPAPCPSASHLPLVPPVGVTEAAKAPLFAVGDTVRVIHPENYPSDIRAGDTTEGTVTHILPDIRKRFVYVCSPIGSWFENQIERVTAAAPAPVSPSLPASVESEALDLLLDGMAKLDLVRKVKSLKADVERLTGALKAVLEIADAPKLHGAETAATISNLVRLSLAEVGKH
jgi:hypothetical protein